MSSGYTPASGRWQSRPTAPPRWPQETDASCGIPVDARYFDSSSVSGKPARGQEIVLARFDLPVGYCGVLEYFAQFTDEYARTPTAVETPAIQWTLLVNREPLDPYLNLRHIVNPWRFGSFGIAVRLPVNARLELVVRGVIPDARDPPDNATRVGGRILGRYWFREGS